MDEEKIIIRHAREGDLKEILKLVCELIEILNNKECVDLNYVPDNLKKIFKENNAYFLVAEEEGDVVGFAHFTTRLTILHPGPSAVVEEIAVKADRRGEGIGEKLLNAIAENCNNIGCSEIEVSTEKANEQAREFYRKLGFSEDAVLFEKHLT